MDEVLALALVRTQTEPVPSHTSRASEAGQALTQ
jgi:hypothetical protein